MHIGDKDELQTLAESRNVDELVTRIKSTVYVNAVWVSTFLALILSVLSLVIFLGIFFSTSNIALGAFVSFGPLC